MKILRSYLLQDAELLSLLDNRESIYLVERPPIEKLKKIYPNVGDQELENENYVIYKYKLLENECVKTYLLEMNIIGKNLSLLMQIQRRIEGILDDKRNEIILRDTDLTIKSIRLKNGGGIIRNPETGNYEIIVFFQFII